MKIFKLFNWNEEDDEYEIKDEYENKDEYEDKFIEKLLEIFVEKNKYKYKIIYKNKIYPLQSIFNIIGIQVETAKFKLLCYNHTLDNNEIPEEFPFYQYLKLEALKTNKKI